MKQIKYSYCLDGDGNLVNIKMLSHETRHNCKYYCLQCNQEMVANLGTKKSWYFSHKAEKACDGESYLHKLAKRRIQDKFNSSITFPITFLRDVPCCESKTCFFSSTDSCKDDDVKIPCDLKLWNGSIVYDTCEEERSVGDFRPDLLLTCSMKNDRKPVFIEIFKTHQSEEAKITSNYKIIETTKINTEDDIDDILQYGFIEGRNCKTYNFTPQLPIVRKDDNPISRFVLFKTGAAKVCKDLDYIIFCNNKDQRYLPHSAIELNLKSQGIDIWGANETNGTLDSYQLGLVYLVKKGWEIRNCILCEHYKYNDFYSDHICILYKKLALEIPRPKQTMANRCQYYQLNQTLMNHNIDEIEKDIEVIKDFADML